MFFFAENKETTIEELANHLKKDYTTALRLLNELLASGLVKISREEATTVRGKKKKIYIITMHGLEGYLFYSNSDVRKVAKAHNDMLLVFEKWDYFVQNECEDILLYNIKDSISKRIATLNIQRNVLKNSFPVDPERLRYAFDCGALGFMFFIAPPDLLQKMLKDRWSAQLKLWKLVEEDIDLKTLKERFLIERQTEYEYLLKNIASWKEFFKGDKGKEF